MCVPYYINGIEITRANNECWCPLWSATVADREATRLEFAAAILNACEAACETAMKPENAAKTEDGRIVEITLRMERW